MPPGSRRVAADPDRDVQTSPAALWAESSPWGFTDRLKRRVGPRYMTGDPRP